MIQCYFCGHDIDPAGSDRICREAPVSLLYHHVTLYHRTTKEAAQAILTAGRMTSKENTGEAYFSTRFDGHATGYGDTVIEVRVPQIMIELDDEFPDGEQHYRVKVAQLRSYHFIAYPRETP